MTEFALECERIVVAYSSLAGRQSVLSELSFAAAAGELVAITGPSGCGKSTLLKVLGGLLAPDRGAVRVAGEPLDARDDRRSAHVRATRIGFVFQRYQLVPFLDVRQNVELPLRIRGFGRPERHRQIASALGFVELAHKQESYPNQLSGGEQQRVAIARAIAGAPPVLLCDEPTGNLSDEGAHQVFDLLHALAVSHGRCVVMATHNQSLADACHRRLRLHDGHLE